MSDAAQAGIKSESTTAFRSFSFGERIKLWLISWAGFLFIRIVGATLRYQFIPEPGCLADERGPVAPSIWCFWHRSVLPATYRFRNQGLAVMTSRSFDGEYIARIIQKLGFIPVRGSSSRGAVGALLGMLAGAVACVRYLRREVAADIGPRLRHVQLQLDNLEAAVNLALVTRYAEMSKMPSGSPITALTRREHPHGR